MMEPVTWRRRVVHDMLFGVEGSGWHPPELHESVGYRWSGPGHLSILRVPPLPGPGRGEAQLVLMGAEPLPEVAVFLNGRPLGVSARRAGAFGLLGFAWNAAAMDEAERAEFWFHAAQVRQLPVPGQGMRGVGFRLASLSLEATQDGPAPGTEALALIAGRRVLADRLPVAPGRARLAFRSGGAARLLEMRLEAARLGASPQPPLTALLRAEDGALALDLGPAGSAALRVTLAASGDLATEPALPPRDAALLARLLAALPQAFAAWLDEAMAGAAPDAALLAAWRRDLGRLARAAEASLARHLADGPDPFGDPAVPFAWPAA